MNLLSDIITYIRRIIKTPSNASITDALLVDYINRFWIMDVDARIQLFDLKTKYHFQTVPGVDQYNMPLYNVQPNPTSNNTLQAPISFLPVYQGFFGPAFINGVPVAFHTQKHEFFNAFPNITQNLRVVGQGNGTSGPYTLSIPIISNIQPNPLNPPLQSLLRGHVDMTGIIATQQNIDPPVVTSAGNFISSIPTTSVFPAVYFTSQAADGSNITISDSGEFLSGNQNLGLLMQPGNAPFGNLSLAGGYTNSSVITGISQANPAVITSVNTFSLGQTIQFNNIGGMTQLNGNTYTITVATPTSFTINVDSTAFSAYISGGTATSFSNVINYFTGVATNVFFPAPVPSGYNIACQCYYFTAGLPRAILFYNNVITLRVPPSKQYLVELDAYLTPAAFLSTAQSIPFGYMSEYIARGAARKILSDTGDSEQLMFYEPFFKEQEMLVWKRSQRQFTATRTQTIYSQGNNNNNWNGLNSFSGGTV